MENYKRIKDIQSGFAQKMELHSLVDDPTGIEIMNFQFFANKNIETRGKGRTLADSITSFRNSLQQQMKTKKANPISISNLLDVDLIFQSIESIKKCLLSIESKFGQSHLLTDFPYQELIFVIMNEDKPETVICSIECINYSLRFAGEPHQSLFNPDFICYLFKLLNIQNTPFSMPILKLIGFLIQFNSELLIFCMQNNLINIVSQHLPKPFAVFVIQAALTVCSIEIANELLFYVFNTILQTEDEFVIKQVFHTLLIFAKRFGCTSIPEKIMQLSPQSQIDGILQESENTSSIEIIYQTIAKYMHESLNFDLIYEILQFCLELPQLNPPNIFDKVIEYLLDDQLKSKHRVAAAETIIHFHECWKQNITKENLSILMKMINEGNLDYKTNQAYSKLVIFFYEIDQNENCLDVLKICIDGINDQDTTFSSMCLAIILKILSEVKTPNLLSSCFEILNDSREYLLTQLDSGDLSDEKLEKVMVILKMTEKFLEFKISSKSESNEFSNH
ncbi:hypothetical protein TRFO_19595 [Tritrichomonas foetus]|uniref:Uncharacterized protein n=1 Tax=Tritrichomonas foetus TaxID=1144522 RepID=A0A1J4KMK1_9EUKA|nr:hypothetical protein TRFO_19595 [Tritrichomonas foetus]|eukprot:OHT10918.1 hypothetical protein TRFO_19595 [Tritrichomonas foetus]